MIRCDNCGFQNPEGALVCRRCRRRLRGRAEAVGPRRESEGQLTVVVAEGLTRLAVIIGAILLLGNLLAWLLYNHRLAPGMLIMTAVAFLAAALGRWQVSSLRNSAAR